MDRREGGRQGRERKRERGTDGGGVHDYTRVDGIGKSPTFREPFGTSNITKTCGLAHVSLAWREF